jgi:hypothetical protein
VVLVAPERLLEIAAGAERAVAGAGEDGDARRVVVAEAAPGLDEPLPDLGADRVHALGAVDGDHDHRAVLLVADEAHAWRVVACVPARPASVLS